MITIASGVPFVWTIAAASGATGGGKTHLAVIDTAVTLAALLMLAPVERRLERFARRKGLVAPENDPTGA